MAELLLERHYEGVQLIAPVSAGVGFVLALFALTRRGKVPVALLFPVLSATGLYGTLEHFEERTEGGPPEQATETTAQLVSDVATPADGELAGPPGGGSAPPWLAPLSVSGSALLGGAATLALGRRGNKTRQT